MDGFIARTEARRIEALKALNAKTQSELGQFFTPSRAAELIAATLRIPNEGTVRILDPGAGVGSLCAAIVHRIVTEAPNVSVEVVAIELDPSVALYLDQTLEDLKKSAAEIGASVVTSSVVGDFIELTTSIIENRNLHSAFDLVIMNPPYAKLPASSGHRLAMVNQGVDCPNLYAAFLAQGADALIDGGQLAAITPRSFANGPYFGQFREHFLNTVSLNRLHVFESRSTVFSDTGVLQENIVFSATRAGVEAKVALSVSAGHRDKAIEKIVDYAEVILPEDPHKFIRISLRDEDTAIAETMTGMPCTLADLGITVSTGKVVDFRVRDYLTTADETSAVPLIYPGNVRDGVIEWPREIKKSQGFRVLDDKAKKQLVPPGYYVAVKRFSAKEERRRIVAAVADPTLGGGTPIAFENHLNVFHCNGRGLEQDVAVGLSLWLNSSTVDQFFRTFSGHTQVNATDLRSLRFPTLENLQHLGKGRDPRLPDQKVIDAIVATLFDASRAAA